jgi:hypothetical protein
MIAGSREPVSMSMERSGLRGALEADALVVLPRDGVVFCFLAMVYGSPRYGCMGRLGGGACRQACTMTPV